MDGGESARQKPVSRHREPNASLTILEHHQRRNHSHDCPHSYDLPNRGEAQRLESVHDRSGVAQLSPVHDTRQYDSDRNIQDRAGSQGAHDADRQVSLGITAFLRGRRYRIETNIGEENDGSPGQQPLKTVREKGLVVGRVDGAGRAEDENQDRGDLDEHHGVVRLGTFANTSHEQDGQNHQDEKRRQIEDRAG